jgi:hypothetical protein
MSYSATAIATATTSTATTSAATATATTSTATTSAAAATTASAAASAATSSAAAATTASAAASAATTAAAAAASSATTTGPAAPAPSTFVAMPGAEGHWPATGAGSAADSHGALLCRASQARSFTQGRPGDRAAAAARSSQAPKLRDPADHRAPVAGPQLSVSATPQAKKRSMFLRSNGWSKATRRYER